MQTKKDAYRTSVRFDQAAWDQISEAMDYEKTTNIAEYMRVAAIQRAGRALLEKQARAQLEAEAAHIRSSTTTRFGDITPHAYSQEQLAQLAALTAQIIEKSKTPPAK